MLVATVAVMVAGFKIGYALVTPSRQQIVANLPALPIPTPTPLSDVARAAIASTVTIESLTSNAEAFGTGWLFDDKGDFVTNDHVVAGAEAIRIRDRTGTAHQAEVVNADRAADVAVVRSNDGFTGTPLPAGTTGAPNGTPVVAIASGRATGHDDVTYENVVAQAESVPVVGGNVDPSQATTNAVYTDMLEVSGSRIYPGDSGGPLLDSSGHVVGIVTLAGKRGNVAYAIPISRVIREVRAFAAG
jgi:putative serine protease PepD